MVDPIATVDDINSRLNTDLTTGEAQPYLEDAAFDNSQSNDVDTMADDLRRQIEWRLAAIKILSIRKGDRSYHSHSVGSINRTYETKMLTQLREELKGLDPSGDLAQLEPKADVEVF